MLSLGKLAHGQQQYYLETVARGLEDYYTGAKEAPGVWVGAAAGRFGLEGAVDAEALGRLLAHVDPSGRYRLTGARSVPVIAGFDATFCAPKSVSLLFALGDPETSNEVRNAHDAAMRGALAVFEGVACRARRGAGGARVIDGDGFVAAGFRHRTSRAGDPHLHTHVVIANLVHAPDDHRWTALDGRPLYAWCSPVGHLYEAQLRLELTRRLGVAWGPVRNGIADVAGISKLVLREFSTRRREIEAHLDEHGQSSARAAQVATYATRRPKDATVTSEGLLPGWRARADGLGFDADALSRVVGRSASIDPPTPGTPRAESLFAALAGAEGLTKRRSTFGQRDVIKAVCNALPYGGRVDDVLGLVDGFLESDRVVALAGPDRSAGIRLADGRTVAARTDELRGTTPEMLAIEARLVASAVRCRQAGVGVARAELIDAVIDAAAPLSGEQAAMVRSLCSSGAGVEVVDGVAGAGKTFALAAARQAWAAAGYHVLGAALAARTARRLEAGAGIASTTLDRLLADIERGGLSAGQVVVVDEAAMVSTRQLERLLARAAHRGQSRVGR